MCAMHACLDVRICVCVYAMTDVPVHRMLLYFLSFNFYFFCSSTSFIRFYYTVLHAFTTLECGYASVCVCCVQDALPPKNPKHS